MAENKCDPLAEGCEGTVGPDFGLDRDGNIPETGSGVCPEDPRVPVDNTCNEFQLTETGKKDSKFISDITNEALNIGGADLNYFKLLGVHEQGKLLDLTGMGQAISGGEQPSNPASNAFDKFVTEWRSTQRGQTRIAESTYIGYDFGEIKTSDDSRRAYGKRGANVRKHISSIAIKQSTDPNRRVTRARIERSQDGTKWFGVQVVLFPDDDCLNTVLFKSSVPSRFWRLRPLDFSGSDTDVWAVQAIQMFDYEATDINNIQDKILMENRDRDYAESILMKGYYDLLDTQTPVTRFAIDFQEEQTFYITVSFSAAIAILGRPPVIGDIVEMPSEAQFSAKLDKILKYVEITDVGWSTEGYTPGWTPTLMRLVAQPAFASQETRGIFKTDLAPVFDESGLADEYDGNSQVYQDYADVTQTIDALSKNEVQERGYDYNNEIRQFEEPLREQLAAQGIDIRKYELSPNALYVEDGMPPNNAPFTEGDEFPDDADNGDYHRLTYTTIEENNEMKIPPRLHRFSDQKNRWIFLEVDRRLAFDPTMPVLQEFLESPTNRPHDEILRDKDC